MSGQRHIALINGDPDTAGTRDIADALIAEDFSVTPLAFGPAFALHLGEMKPDLVLVADPGPEARDGRIQGVCEALRIPYTHSGIAATAVANDRHLSKLALKSAGIPVTDHVLADRAEAARTHILPPPYIAKSRYALAGGAPVIVPHQEEALPEALLGADWAGSDEVMIERFLPGQTLCAFIMGDVLIGIAAVTDATKSNESETLIPASISPKIYEECTRLALRAHGVLGCRGVTALTFRYDERQAFGTPVMLGLDPQPDLSRTGPLSRTAERAGHSFGELLGWIVQDASCGRMG